ncbi:O-antigen ligase family protein [Algihabitans albus]|uniref:O-antigen ligase family protein n=1 Tax=Algihabitans albus TaxID=2164067 RepID=UPI000E5CD47A|nr:O-antigen ligase family protein [Algihabitans albus]
MTDSPRRTARAFLGRARLALSDRAELIALLVLLAGFPILSTAMHRWILYALGIVVLLRLTILRQSIRLLLPRPLFLASGAFIAYGLLSAIWSPVLEAKEIGEAVLAAVTLVVLLAMGLQVAKAEADAPYGIERVLVLFVLICGAICSIYLILYQQGIDDLIVDGSRLGGLGQVKNPVLLGFVAAAALLAALALRGELRRLGGWAAAPVLIAVLFATVIATESRGPLVALFGGLGLLLLLERRWRTLAVLATALAILAAVIATGALDEFHRIGMADNQRFAIWSAALEQIAARPWFGYGALYEPELAGYKATHSLYIGALLYGGVIGGLLLAVIVALTLIAGLRAAGDPAARALTAMFALGLIGGLFEFHALFKELDPEWLLFWIPLALLLGRETVQRSRR